MKLTEAESIFCNHIADVVDKKWSSLDLVGLFENKEIKSCLQEVLVEGKTAVIEIIRKYLSVASFVRHSLCYKEYEHEQIDVLDAVFYETYTEDDFYITEYLKIDGHIITHQYSNRNDQPPSYKIDKILITDILSTSIIELLTKENIRLEKQSASFLKTLFDLQEQIKQINNETRMGL